MNSDTSFHQSSEVSVNAVSNEALTLYYRIQQRFIDY